MAMPRGHVWEEWVDPYERMGLNRHAALGISPVWHVWSTWQMR
jgi:hypothetical protein